MSRFPITLRALSFWLLYAALTVAGAFFMYTQSLFWSGSMTLSELLKVWHVYNYYYLPVVVLSLGLYAALSKTERTFAGVSAEMGGFLFALVGVIMIYVKRGVLN